MRDKNGIIKSISKATNLSLENSGILFRLLDNDKFINETLAIKKQLQYASQFRLSVKMIASISRVVNGQFNNIIIKK